MSSDLDVFKDIPGYKSILKSVLKSQIQHLLDQLSKHTGEESVILTANLDDGVLSHQGSGTGKSFLEGRDEIKSQFLGFCLKSHHRKQMAENRVSPYQRPDPKTPNRLGPMSKVPQKSPRPLTSVGNSSSTPIHRATDETVTSVTQDPAPSLENMSGLASISRGKEITLTDRNGAVVKVERAENSASSKELRVTSIESTVTNFPPSLELSHTQISGQSGTVNNASVDLNSDSTTHLSAATNDTSFDNDDSNGATSIKIEPITENEMELEITGVEPGSSSNLSPEKWGPSSSTYSGTGASGDEMTSSTDATSYREMNPDVAKMTELSSKKPTPSSSQTSGHPSERPIRYQDQIDLTGEDDAGDAQHDANQTCNNDALKVVPAPTPCQMFSKQDLQNVVMVRRGAVTTYALPPHSTANSTIIEQTNDPECNLSILNVASLSGDLTNMVPAFLSEDQQNQPCSSASISQSSLSKRRHLNVNPYQNDSDDYIDEDDDDDDDQDDDYYGNDDDVDDITGETTIDPSMPVRESFDINPYKCVKFNKKFYGKHKNRIMLKKHICEMCGKRMLKKSDLDRHMRVHTGEKPFKCRGCNKWYGDRSNLRTHRQRMGH